MERPSQNLIVPRALTAALLAGALAAAAWEARMPSARRVREGRPILSWVAVAEPPLLFLAVYRPALRSLDLLYVPPASMGARRRARVDAAAAQEWLGARLPPNPSWPPASLALPPGSLSGEDPPAALKSWILDHVRGVGFWRGLPSLAVSPQMMPVAERLLLALELSRVPPERIRPAWLPEDSFAPILLSRLLAPEGSRMASLGRAVTAEVLNATGEKGVATAATNVLRLKGLDVVFTGNAPPRASSAVYDRSGRFEAAGEVARLLGCPESAAQTQVDLKKLVDVTVVLSTDCGITGARRNLWSWWKS